MSGHAQDIRLTSGDQGSEVIIGSTRIIHSSFIPACAKRLLPAAQALAGAEGSRDKTRQAGHSPLALLLLRVPAPRACGCRCPHSGPLSVRRGPSSHPALNQPLVFVQPGDKAVSRFSMTKSWPVPRSPPQRGEMGQGGAALSLAPRLASACAFTDSGLLTRIMGSWPLPPRPGPDLHLALKLSVQPPPAPAAPPPPGLRHSGHP